MLRRLAFVELAVDDWDAAVRYYRDVIGLRLVHYDADRRWALFQPPAGDAGVAVFQRAAGKPDVALTFECSDLDATGAEWIGRGARPLGEPTTSPEGYRLLRFVDPAGRRLNLFEFADDDAAR